MWLTGKKFLLYCHPTPRFKNSWPTESKDALGDLEMVHVTFVKKEKFFICQCTFEKRNIPKEAGFRWDQQGKVWYTPDARVAARLKDHCDNEAKNQINQICLQEKPWTAPLCIPPSETLKPFQIEAVKFALAKNRCYLALDPGLGKTPIAAVISETLNAAQKTVVVYICPPFLTRNTEAEFSRWAPSLVVSRFNPKSNMSNEPAQVLIVPDSVIARGEVVKQIQAYVRVNKRDGFTPILFVDEAHRFKNDTAARTQALLGHHRKELPGIITFFERVVYLSGTPMPNRPMELFPILSKSAPEVIDHKNKFQYGLRYCGAFENEWGWDFSGASNIGELVSKVIGTFMLRMRKKDVLKELPPKTEEMVILSDNAPPRLAALDKKILEKHSPEDLIKMTMPSYGTSENSDEIHISTYRRELGLAKVESVTDYISYYLKETDESLLVFAIHTEVIAELAKALASFDPLVITGDTPMKSRHEIVKTFQTDNSRRLFIGNIQAAGTGLTLTKAARVIMAEYSWVPADNEQAGDRSHRIGQTENVFVQYLVFKNSVDRAVLETILRKKKITEKL